MPSFLSLVCIAGLVSTGVCYAGMIRLIFSTPALSQTLDITPGWDRATAFLILSQQGAIGRQAYYQLHWQVLGDMLLPVCYGVFFCTLLWITHPRRRWTVVLPLMASLCDIVENLCVDQLLATFPDFNGADLALALGPGATVCKWAFLLGTLLVAFAAIVTKERVKKA